MADINRLIGIHRTRVKRLKAFAHHDPRMLAALGHLSAAEMVSGSKDKNDHLTAAIQLINQIEDEQRLMPKAAQYSDVAHRLAEALAWALGELNTEPYEWSCDEQSDAHNKALAAIRDLNEIDKRAEAGK